MVKIIIPSYRRPSDVLALNNVDQKTQKRHYMLALRKSEIDAYRKNYPRVPVLEIPDDVAGIRDTRQCINEQMHGEKIMQLDDDKQIFTSYRGEKYLRINKAEERGEYFYDMLVHYLDHVLDNFVFGSIKATHFPLENDKCLPNLLNKTALWATLFNLKKIDPYRFNYNHGPWFIEDVYMSCKIFDAGYDIVNVTKYLITSRKSTASQPGGCTSPDRSVLHTQSAEELEALFPRYCKAYYSNFYKNTLFGQDTKTVRCTLKR